MSLLANGQQYFFERIVEPKYQIGLLILTSFVIVLLALIRMSYTIPLEPVPQIFSVTPKQIREWGGNAAKVVVGLHIVNFPKFDIESNNFVIDAIIWFEFDPALVSLETIEKFSFEKGDITTKTTSNTKVIGNRFFAQYNITVQFTSNLAFEFFPLDDHRIFLILTNKFVSPSELIYEAFNSGFTMSESVFTAGWRIVDKDVMDGYSESYLDESDHRKVVMNPNVIFSVNFARSGVQQVLLIFLPLFLMFFVGVFSFSFDAISERSLVLALSLGSVTAILSYRFVIQGMSPPMGYFLLSDHIFTMFLFFSVVCFFVNTLLSVKKEKSSLLLRLRGVIFIVFHLLLILVWYYLLFRWTITS